MATSVVKSTEAQLARYSRQLCRRKGRGPEAGDLLHSCTRKSKMIKRNGLTNVVPAAISLILIVGLLTPVVPAAADSKSKVTTKVTKGLSEDQRIVHVLNRLGFGPRPGDVERVKRIGLDKYIDQQLHPERVDDSAIEARLANFPSLRMSTAEVQDKYPTPQLL